RVDGQGLQRTRGGEGRGDSRIAHDTGHTDGPMLQGEAGGGDRQRIHRLAEGGAELLVEAHAGGRIDRNRGAHGRRNDVRGHTGGEAPAEVTHQRVAGEVLGRGGDRRRVSRQGRQIDCGRERRGDADVAHRPGDRSHALLQREAGGGDRQRTHGLTEGGGEVRVHGHGRGRIG